MIQNRLESQQMLEIDYWLRLNPQLNDPKNYILLTKIAVLYCKVWKVLFFPFVMFYF